MKKMLSIILCAILFLDVVSLGVLFFTNDKPSLFNRKKDEDKDSVVSVVAVGDNIVQENIIDQAFARTGNINYDFTYPYDNVSSLISSADISVLNQESVISTDHNVSGSPLYNSPIELGKEMAKIGFDIVNIASNHSLDYGEKGLINTINFWKDEGLRPIGAYSSKTEANMPVITEKNGIKIAWVSFTETTNGNSLPENSDTVLVLSKNETDILNMVKIAKQSADVVIVVAHWGNEYESELSESQIDMASKLASWGADVIIGSHPHVLQNIEYIENTDGSKTLVAYSLGNFISSQSKETCMLGGLLNFDIVMNNTTKEVEINNVKLSGLITHYGHNLTNVRIYPLDQYTEVLASKHGIKELFNEFSLSYIKKLLETSIDKQFLK